MSTTKRQIQTVKAREILDSRGNPTVEAVVILSDGSAARAAAPSGASTGEYEAPELRDNDPARYLGKGVSQAIRQVKELIAPALLARDASCQQQVDEILCSLTDPKTPAKNSAPTRCSRCRWPAPRRRRCPTTSRSTGIWAGRWPTPCRCR